MLEPDAAVTLAAVVGRSGTVGGHGVLGVGPGITCRGAVSRHGDQHGHQPDGRNSSNFASRRRALVSRNYSEEEWRELLESAGLEIERVETFAKTHDLDAWLARTQCTGEDAVRVRELLAPHTSEDGKTWHDTKLIVKARKSQK